MGIIERNEFQHFRIHFDWAHCRHLRSRVSKLGLLPTQVRGVGCGRQQVLRARALQTGDGRGLAGTVHREHAKTGGLHGDDVPRPGQRAAPGRGV